MELETDAMLIARSLREPAALGVIFDRHGGAIAGYLLRRLERGKAENALGEVFRIAFENRDRYQLDRDDCRPWLYGIASNLVARERRSEMRRLRALERMAAEREHPDDEALQVAGRLDAERDLAAVLRAVAELPDGERDVVLLCAWEGLSYDEVARALGVPIGTVRSRLNRARRHLRELTDGHGEVVSNEPEAAPGRWTR